MLPQYREKCERKRDMKRILAPSILSADFSILGEQIKEADEAGAEFIHIDVMDGMFVPSISFGLPVIQTIRKVTKKIFDVHLMIVQPERYLEEFAKAGADYITIHYEATEDVAGAIKKIHEQGCKAGISVKPGTDVRMLKPFVGDLDLILIMSVEPGFGGQTILESSFDKIRTAAKMIEEAGREIRLSVDGGITLLNVNQIIDAGADTIVSGSSVFKGNISKNVEEFERRLKA